MKSMVYPMSYVEQWITDDLYQYSAPLCMFPRRKFEPGDLQHNATVAFVNTGQDELLVTCHHVWDEFSKLKADNPEMVMAAPIGPGHSLVVLDGLSYVDGDRKFLDVAVLRLRNPEILHSGSKAYYLAASWPNEMARQNELVALIGYPAQHRRPGENSIKFSTTRICDYVTRVTDRQMIIRDDAGERQQFNHEEGIEQLTGDLGGMSGSPVFSIRKGKFELTGFFTDGFGTVNGSVLASHAHFILPDGKLRPLPWT